MLDVKAIFWESLRSYFAPLVGAYRAVKQELAKRDERRRR